MWWHTAIIPALREWRQEDQKFRVIIDYERVGGQRRIYRYKIIDDVERLMPKKQEEPAGLSEFKSWP